MKKLKTKKTTTSRKAEFNPTSWDEVEAGKKIDPPKPSAVGKYPPPKKHPVFVKRWREYIDDVVKRENFKRGHLAQLAVLCDLYVEYDKLEELIDENGFTYETHGQSGLQIKQRPEVGQMNRVRSEIRNYSKILGLLLVKDKEAGEDDESDQEESWE